MREICREDLPFVSGGNINVNRQVKVVKAVNTSVSVTQKIVQRNGVTLIDTTCVVISH